ncbi:MAG: tRNA pseudouridine(55) synthase TruB [Acidimicrobiales bacterium]
MTGPAERSARPVTDGLVVVDKAAGCTSHDVVARCRRIFGQRRVGHAGTLDPDATGVLLVGLGRVTRLLRFLTVLPKSYTAEVVLGVATSTLDASGEVVGEWDMGAVSLAQVQEAATGFVGEIDQVPPMVSAVRVGGRRLHELARAGVEVERAARRVVVHRFDVSATEEPGVLRVEVDCGSGTYVRSLAADIGAALGGGAHLRNLRRTAIGSFTAADGLAVDQLGEADVLSPAAALRDYPRLVLDGDGVREVSFGRGLATPNPGPHALVDQGGHLLAVYDDGRPAVVLAPAG